MTLKLHGISNDPLKQMAVVTFADVLDDFPQIQVTIEFVTAAHLKESDILTAIKAQTRTLLGEAIERLDHFSGL